MSLDIVILEGPRGTGKTTVAQILRRKINYSTLINPTGFPEDGMKGLIKINAYYTAWMKFLREASYVGQPYRLIFDRFFFTEMVFSSLYKSYDFRAMFEKCWHDLIVHADKVDIFYFTVDDQENLHERLDRDKPQFASVVDSLTEYYRQADAYNSLFSEIYNMSSGLPNVFVHKLDTSNTKPDAVAEKIITLLNT
jgi:deoxyguanosine kinase